MAQAQQRPMATADLVGTGGVFKASPEDFVVEELPAYEPSGEGPHLYLWVEKRGLSGGRMLDAVARHFETPRDGLGQAGIKDTMAVTRQWISVPDDRQRFDPEAQVGLEPAAGVQVLAASRHRNRLKTGHLRGNRFELLVRGVGPEGLARAEAVLEALDRLGLPNYYGDQRFGRDGDNVEVGLALLRGEDTPEARRARRDKFKRRLLITAVQSHAFNTTLQRRMEAGLMRTILDGDLCERLDSGARFEVQDVEREQARFDLREIVHTCPMPGHSGPVTTRAAAELEQGVMDELGLSAETFKPAGKLAQGTRRASLVYPGQARAEAVAEGVLRLSFSLPAGSYATEVLREVIKDDGTGLDG